MIGYSSAAFFTVLLFQLCTVIASDYTRTLKKIKKKKAKCVDQEPFCQDYLSELVVIDKQETCSNKDFKRKCRVFCNMCRKGKGKVNTTVALSKLKRFAGLTNVTHLNYRKTSQDR